MTTLPFIWRDGSAGGTDLKAVNLNAATSAVLSRWTPADALHRRVKAELTRWTDWLETYAPGGLLGEFGWPGNQYASGDADKWNLLGEGYYRQLQTCGLWSTQWGASQAFAAYELAPYIGGGLGSPLTVAQPQSAPLESHAEDVGVRRGVAITGLEFGTDAGSHPTFSNTNPGTFGTDYYLEPPESFAFVAARGPTLTRVGFRWERMQPTLGGALDNVYLLRLINQVQNAASAGMLAIVDCHNYGEYIVAPGASTPAAHKTIGDGTLTQAHFVDLWTRLSAALQAQPGCVGYGLMNEPHDIAGGVDGWQDASQAAVDAIRAGGDNKIVFVGGYNWSKVQEWADVHPAPWISDFNFMYEAHHYWDSESSQFGLANSVYTQTYASALADAVAAGY